MNKMFHNRIEEYINANYQNKYIVYLEKDKKIYLPFSKKKLKQYEILYNPDIVLSDLNLNEIKYIIEIEENTDPSSELR